MKSSVNHRANPTLGSNVRPRGLPPAPISVALRVGIAGVLVVATRLTVHLELHGLEHDSRAPRTYFAILHKRDLDSMAPLPAILAHGGWRRLARDLRFAMRADSFEPGFLSRVVRHPAWFSRALHPFSVGPILRAVGVQPLTGFHTRPAETWLRDVLAAEGELPAGDVFSPAALAALATATGEPAERIATLRLSRLLAWRYSHHLPLLTGPEPLAGTVRRRAERRAVAEAKAGLASAASWVRAGGSLYGSPEGGFTTDGRIGPITSGFHRLVRAASATWVVPVAIVYDFMTTRRMGMFVDLGPAIQRAGDLPRDELEQRLRASWRSAGRFTCTQLGAAYLVERGQSAEPTFTRDELVAVISERVRELDAAGRHVDARLLTPAGARWATEGFLSYAVRHGCVKAAGRERWRVLPVERGIAVAPGEVGYGRWPLAYADNEYRELLTDEATADPREDRGAVGACGPGGERPPAHGSADRAADAH